ncbi:hypothetical protein R75461_08379 [Paraburkholderia nemoris]|nr:hypothetical protein R75461_08379 [Paraburkholderia nemoris]
MRTARDTLYAELDGSSRHKNHNRSCACDNGARAGRGDNATIGNRSMGRPFSAARSRNTARLSAGNAAYCFDRPSNSS